MFEWLLRPFQRSNDEKRRHFFAMIDSLNAESAGGSPTVVDLNLGGLVLRSRTLILGDPQYVPSVEIPNFATDHVEISARTWKYPSGATTVAALEIRATNAEPVGSRRKIADLGVDSAKIVVADKLDIERYWTETGEDRIGVISTARNDRLLRMLKARFKLKTVQINRVRAEVVGPVSEELERDIVAHLESVPEYDQFPYMHFHVQTNNSFDRVNFMQESWRFLPIGNADTPLMFACGTGRGDGTYDVNCGFVGDAPVLVTVPFIENE